MNSLMRDYFNGYIIVEITGLNPEKFLNMASKYGILMWDIKRNDYTSIEFKMNYNQYKGLKSISYKTKCKVKVKKKFGIWTVSWKIKKRKFFIIGIATFFLILYYFSSLIWNINIYGNKTIDNEKINKELESLGVCQWKRKSLINTRKVENKIITDISEIAIVNIKFKGTTAEVEIIERSMPPKMVSNDEACNIISKKEGIIKNVSVLKGEAEVKTGDYIKKNQLLVTGEIKDKEGNIIQKVHSMAQINATTWYEDIESIPLRYNYEERTGNIKKKEYLVFFDKKVCIKNDSISFIKYDKIEEKKIMQMENRNLPFAKIVECYYEKVDKYKDLNYEDAVKIGKDKAENKIKKQIDLDAKIEDIKVEKSLQNNTALVKVLYITEEKIGIESLIK